MKSQKELERLFSIIRLVLDYPLKTSSVYMDDIRSCLPDILRCKYCIFYRFTNVEIAILCAFVFTDNRYLLGDNSNRRYIAGETEPIMDSVLKGEPVSELVKPSYNKLIECIEHNRFELASHIEVSKCMPWLKPFDLSDCA